MADEILLLTKSQNNHNRNVYEVIYFFDVSPPITTFGDARVIVPTPTAAFSAEVNALIADHDASAPAALDDGSLMAQPVSFEQHRGESDGAALVRMRTDFTRAKDETIAGLRETYSLSDRWFNA